MKYLLATFFVVCGLQTLAISYKNENVGLVEKIAQLKDIAATKSIIKLNSAKFKEFVKWPHRNYSFVVKFTALEPHRQCSICKAVNDEYLIAAKSFHSTHGNTDRLFFGVLDFDEGSDVFQALQINTAPLIVYFPAKRKVNKISDVHTLDMQRVGFSAEAVARWIADKTDMEFKVLRPPNYINTLALLMMLMIGSIVMYFKQDNFRFLQNRTMWAVITISFCLMMTSGQMWNHIRGPPFLHRTNNGYSYIHGSSQGQFVSETYLIFILNGCFAACIIAIIENGFNKDSTGGRITTSVAVIFAALLFSAVLSIFKAKAGGYPYRGLL